MARYVLNDESYALLREIFRAYKDEIFGSEATARREEQVDYLPPEVYCVFTPAGGVAALSQGTDTGTNGTALDDDVPGWAECKVYRIRGERSGARLRYAGFSVVAYNLNTFSIAGSVWATVKRDKFGRWVFDTIGLATTTC